MTCRWDGCVQDAWRPYSKYCPTHFAQNATASGQRAWARERFCGVLNGYTPHLGDVDWKTNWPRSELVSVATDLGLSLDSLREVQWRQAQARATERHPHRWERYDRTIPQDYEGPGARVAAKTSREGNGLTDDLHGYGLN